MSKKIDLTKRYHIKREIREKRSMDKYLAFVAPNPKKVVDKSK